jgi:hypothetical protein
MFMNEIQKNRGGQFPFQIQWNYQKSYDVDLNSNNNFESKMIEPKLFIYNKDKNLKTFMKSTAVNLNDNYVSFKEQFDENSFWIPTQFIENEYNKNYDFGIIKCSQIFGTMNQIHSDCQPFSLCWLNPNDIIHDRTNKNYQIPLVMYGYGGIKEDGREGAVKTSGCIIRKNKNVYYTNVDTLGGDSGAAVMLRRGQKFDDLQAKIILETDSLQEQRYVILGTHCGYTECNMLSGETEHWNYTLTMHQQLYTYLQKIMKYCPPLVRINQIQDYQNYFPQYLSMLLSSTSTSICGHKRNLKSDNPTAKRQRTISCNLSPSSSHVNSECMNVD